MKIPKQNLTLLTLSFLLSSATTKTMDDFFKKLSIATAVTGVTYKLLPKLIPTSKPNVFDDTNLDSSIDKQLNKNILNSTALVAASIPVSLGLGILANNCFWYRSEGEKTWQGQTQQGLACPAALILKAWSFSLPCGAFQSLHQNVVEKNKRKRQIEKAVELSDSWKPLEVALDNLDLINIIDGYCDEDPYPYTLYSISADEKIIKKEAINFSKLVKMKEPPIGRPIDIQNTPLTKGSKTYSDYIQVIAPNRPMLKEKLALSRKKSS